MLTQGNYKVKSSRLIVGEDSSTQLELTVYGYPKPFTALFELVPVQSEEDRLEVATRQICIDYLRLKFDSATAEAFIEYTDTTPEQWLKYIATNKATGEVELQRWVLYDGIQRFVEEEF